MSAAVRVEVGARTASVFGPGKVVVPAMKLCRTPRQFDDRRRCWLIPVSHASDLIAAIEYRVGGVVDVVNE